MHAPLLAVLASTCQFPGINETFFLRYRHLAGSLPSCQIWDAPLEISKTDSLTLQVPSENRITGKGDKMGEFAYSPFGDLKDEFLK